MPHATETNGIPADKPKEARKLILCFDGTGNSFSGTNADTNVVKLLNKLDRNDPSQFHYYQTGIGTYDVDSTSVDQSWFGNLKSSVDQTLDSGFGSGFDSHVLAGYRFLMRYYESGDKIYMFGFSRGAFTAKFLARMVNTVGLLCKGNEEMVNFVYRLYQRSLAGKIEEFAKPETKAATSNGAEAQPLLHDNTDDDDEDSHHPGHHEGHNELEAFSNTFCRKESVVHGDHKEEQNIKVYFLGLWDCVSSVAVLEQQAPKPIQMAGTAQYVRHAVAVDERRVKFKAALFAQDKTIKDHEHDDSQANEDIKEVWFPGCHGDVGGGWPASTNNPLDTRQDTSKWGVWARVKNLFTTRKKNHLSLDKGALQMSDVPLAWMIREIEEVGKKEESAAVKWRGDRVEKFKAKFQKRKQQALEAIYHDSLRFGYGTSLATVMMWKFMEWFPLIKRWEFVDNDWQFIRRPLNKGNTRDIPRDALLHQSLISRLTSAELAYFPTNNHGENAAPCLKHEGRVPELEQVVWRDGKLVKGQEADSDHQTWRFGAKARNG